MAKVIVQDVIDEFLNVISNTSPPFNWFGWSCETSDDTANGELDDNLVTLIGCDDLHDVVEIGISLLSARIECHHKTELKSCYYLSMGIPRWTISGLLWCNIKLLDHRDVVEGKVVVENRDQWISDECLGNVFLNDADEMNLDDVILNIRMSCLKYQGTDHPIELAIISDVSRVRNSSIAKSLCEFRKLSRELNISIVAVSFIHELKPIDPENADIYLRLEASDSRKNEDFMRLMPIFGMDRISPVIMHKHDNGSIKLVSTKSMSEKYD